MTSLNDALAYAVLGWRVLPVHCVVDGHCSCGHADCTSPGKHPRTLHGVKDATDDKEQIEAWWREMPGANIGIATGARSGLMVIDVDPRHGGDISIEQLEGDLGKLPDTLRVTTQSNGWHLYFSHPGGVVRCSTGKLAPGIDVRADGGYVVAPPSKGLLGVYAWDSPEDEPSDPIASLPPSWLARIQETAPSSPPNHKLDAVIPEGQRNTELARLAGTMRRQGMSEKEILAALLITNRNRCSPPLSEDEVHRIVKSVGRYPPSDASRARVGRDADDSTPDHAARAAERARHQGLLSFVVGEACRRAAEKISPSAQARTAWTPERAAGALAGIDGVEEDLVARVIEGDAESVRSAYRTGSSGGDSAELRGAIKAVGAGQVVDIGGRPIAMTWEVGHRSSADTGTLRTPGFSDRLSLENASRRVSCAKKLARAHRLEVTDDILASIDSALQAFAELDADSRAEASDHDREDTADQIVALVEDHADELFHTPGGLDADCYVTVPVEGHREVWPIDSRGFKRWIGHQFHSQYGKTPGDTTLQSALNVLGGKAMFDGDEHEVFVRRAFVNGKLYLDLADGSGQVIEIDGHGWRQADPIAHGVHFLRRNGTLPLPMPVAGGTVDELRAVLNVPDDQDWVLAKGFLLSCFHPTGPYLGLAPNGEQGSGKSYFSRTIRRTIDPSDRDLRRPITNEADLAIAATSSMIVAVDNLSRLSDGMSDAYCSLATGAALSKRRLYTDFDEASVYFKRPVLLNGINNVATRADLADRVLPLHLPTLPKSKRRSEKKLEAAFTEMHPRVLGALLTAASAALRRVDDVVIDEAERMVDVLIWVVAAEPELGITSGDFQKAYADKVTSAAREALEDSPVSTSIVEAVEGWRKAGINEWKGTCKDLLEVLNARWGEKKPPKNWPGSPQGLHHALRRAAPLLRREGIEVVEPGEHDRPRDYCLRFPGDQGPGVTQGEGLGTRTSPGCAGPTFAVDPSREQTSGLDGPERARKGASDVADISDVSRGPLATPGAERVASADGGVRPSDVATTSRNGSGGQGHSPAQTNSMSLGGSLASADAGHTDESDASLPRAEQRPGNVGNVGNVETGLRWLETGTSAPTFPSEEMSGDRRASDGASPAGGAEPAEAAIRHRLEQAIARGNDILADFAFMELARLVGDAQAKTIKREVQREIRGGAA